MALVLYAVYAESEGTGHLLEKNLYHKSEFTKCAEFHDRKIDGQHLSQLFLLRGF